MHSNGFPCWHLPPTWPRLYTVMISEISKLFFMAHKRFNNLKISMDHKLTIDLVCMSKCPIKSCTVVSFIMIIQK